MIVSNAAAPRKVKVEWNASVRLLLAHNLGAEPPRAASMLQHPVTAAPQLPCDALSDLGDSVHSRKALRGLCGLWSHTGEVTDAMHIVWYLSRHELTTRLCWTNRGPGAQ